MSAEPKPSLEALSAALNARFRGPLMAFFLRKVRHREDAEDLTQETFARLLASPQAADLNSAEAFVFKVATNLLRDRARRQSVRGWQVPVPEEGNPEETSEGLVEDRAPERVLLGREELALALRALNELGERTRDIFILARLENMKQKEIAALFGLSVSTVEKHLIRATQHLAKRFGESE
jgi:RNA polymerase sigma-70 factor (ECF subfamily)